MSGETDWGGVAETRLAEIARLSEEGPGVTRLPFTPEHRAALEVIRGWMAAAGLETRLDAAGTLIGATGPADAPALLLGSHQDSVREGGRYDGIMGVLLPCLALEALRAEGATPPGRIEVLCFADEEGVRFPTALMGPRALAGTFDPAALALTDAEGVSLGDALADFGGDPAALAALRRDPAMVRGFLETHIEQGPVLERADRPLGVVTGICGIERHAVTVTGETGHAGTMPMDGRRDALVAAARLVDETHRRALAEPAIRATVGRLTAQPGSVNAVPSRVEMTLEVRSVDDAAREGFADGLRAFADTVAAETGTGVAIERTYAQPAARCDPALSARLAAAAEEAGHAAGSLPSGATHDASAMADLCPIAMLFLRCRDGVSHRPDEAASAADMGAAVAALAAFLRDMPAA